MKWNFATLPNKITLLRLICVPFLWFWAIIGMGKPFALLLAFAGLTDIADGFIARTWKMKTRFGAWFDSLADNLLSFSAVFWFWLLLPDFLMAHMSIILGVFFLFLLNVALGYLKFHQMVHYHLYSSKAANCFLYLFFLHALLFGTSLLFFYVSLGVIALSILEEMAVSFTSKEIEPDRISIIS